MNQDLQNQLAVWESTGHVIPLKFADASSFLPGGR